MRLLCSFENEGQGREFSQFLTSEGIANDCEVLSVSDWGSDAYGNHFCRIWVVDEDQIERAQTFYDEFIADPNALRFKQKLSLTSPTLEPEGPAENLAKITKSTNSLQAQPIGFVTLFIISICTLLFMWESPPEIPKNFPPQLVSIAWLTGSPIPRTLLFDYPKAYQIVNELQKLYSMDVHDEGQPQPPADAIRLLNQYAKTPYWTGLYDKVVFWLRGEKDKINYHQPMFEKIRQGEVWRFVSPALLHGDILHLFFNMIWLLILGKQMEYRIGGARYILFILITAAFSNTLQYLMSGSNFVGISGVVTAMLGFIYVRQKRAAWEGYLLQRVTLGFLAFFILAMLGVQVVSFFTEVYSNVALMPRIANTAHIAGAFIGYCFGYLKFFTWRRS